MMWIHNQPQWPDLDWDLSELALKLAHVRHMQGQLLGRMGVLGFESREQASLKTLTSDIVKSSAIEGEKLNPDEVRSSIAQRLGIDIGGLQPVSRDVEGVVEMMLDATQNYDQPLTQDRLFDWHAALFPTGRSGMQKITVANWRTLESGPMQVVSGPIGREKVHFEAPSADRLSTEMTRFIRWFDGDHQLDPVIKAGVAHLWFVTIHPFEDGNGRIGRAIADMALARGEKQSQRFYSLSTQIEAERKAYYHQLEKTQRGSIDITQWLDWFLDCLARAIERANLNLDSILYKTKLWESINQDPVNARQKQVINRMLEEQFEGHMNTSKYAKLAKCSNDTALRDIQALEARHIFLKNPGRGRSTSYRLCDEPDKIL